ncbi:MAG: hypothetical protein H0U53_04785 [Actinobacteria bacterium]|nr:hypothetical protein [Actinomycetota bacterium]
MSDVAQSNERTLVLVVDDCDPEERSTLSRAAEMARGRVRLITVGSRSTRERHVSDSRYLELLPLAVAASKEIARSVGLDEREADLVAELTEGYPGLALILSKAIRFGTPGESLIDRVRRHEEIGPLLSRLLPSADVIPLGMLALFEKLGFDGDAAPELSMACEVFAVDESQVRALVQRELKRFVSTAGRFRRVTPRLFAVWLASQFMQDRQGAMAAALGVLPDFLRDRIVTQMRDYAGDEVVARVLGDLLKLPPFCEGAIGDVDDGAGRLLHVAAIGAPEAAMDAIERVLINVTPEELREWGPGRRGMIYALEVLLWFEHLYQRAASALLLLAVSENETWSNNSTGILQGTFRLQLGGTSAPYSQRLEWARDEIEAAQPGVLPILVGGLRHALESHEARAATDFGGRSAPPEWRPASVEEEFEARSGAWDLLVYMARTSHASIPLVADAIARGMRVALRRGLTQRVLEHVLSIPWSAKERGLLGDGLGKALEFEQFGPEEEAELRWLQAELQGHSLADRLDYVLSQPIWQLSTSRDEMLSGRPRVLLEVASELARSDNSDLLEAAVRSSSGDLQTAGVLFEEIAIRQNDESLIDQLQTLDPVPEAAVIGAILGISKSRPDHWVDSVIECWLGLPLASLLIRTVHSLKATDERASLAIQAVDQGASKAAELGLFLYGGWVRPLEGPTISQLLRRFADSGGTSEIEHALGILDHWLEERTAVEGELRSLAIRLIAQSTGISGWSSPMVALYRSRVIRALGLDVSERLGILVDLLRASDSFADSHDLEILDAIVEEDPIRATEAIVDLFIDENGGYQPWLSWLGDARLLSRLERLSSAELVTGVVMGRVVRENWARLIEHIDMSAAEPDHLLVALLDESDDSALRGRAGLQFMYPAMVWTGRESEHLKERRVVAERWLDAARPDSGFRSWLEQLYWEIGQRISVVEAEEAERGY